MYYNINNNHSKRYNGIYFIHIYISILHFLYTSTLVTLQHNNVNCAHTMITGDGKRYAVKPL